MFTQVLSDLVLRAVLILQVIALPRTPPGFFDALRIRGLWGFRKQHDSWQKVLLSLADPSVEKWVMSSGVQFHPPDASGNRFYLPYSINMCQAWCSLFVIKDWTKCLLSCWSIGGPLCSRLVPISWIRLLISESPKLGLLLWVSQLFIQCIHIMYITGKSKCSIRYYPIRIYLTAEFICSGLPWRCPVLFVSQLWRWLLSWSDWSRPPAKGDFKTCMKLWIVSTSKPPNTTPDSQADR